MLISLEAVVRSAQGDGGDVDGAQCQSEGLCVADAVHFAGPVEYRFRPVELRGEVGLGSRAEIPSRAALAPWILAVVIGIGFLPGVFAAFGGEELVCLEGFFEEAGGILRSQADESREHFTLEAHVCLVLRHVIVEFLQGFLLDPCKEVRVPGISDVRDVLVNRDGSAGAIDSRVDSRNLAFDEIDGIREDDVDSLSEVECHGPLDVRIGVGVQGKDNLLSKRLQAVDLDLVFDGVVLKRDDSVLDTRDERPVRQGIPSAGRFLSRVYCRRYVPGFVLFPDHRDVFLVYLDVDGAFPGVHFSLRGGHGGVAYDPADRRLRQNLPGDGVGAHVAIGAFAGHVEYFQPDVRRRPGIAAKPHRRIQRMRVSPRRSVQVIPPPKGHGAGQREDRPPIRFDHDEPPFPGPGLVRQPAEELRVQLLQFPRGRVRAFAQNGAH